MGKFFIILNARKIWLFHIIIFLIKNLIFENLKVTKCLNKSLSEIDHTHTKKIIQKSKLKKNSNDSNLNRENHESRNGNIKKKERKKCCS